MPQTLSTPPAQPQAAPPTIALVDDDRNILTSVAMALEAEGFRVRTFTDGAEALRAMAAEPKLLIADESMAGLTHSEVEEILALLMRLNAQGVTIILIEHIMSAVMSFSQRLAVLVSGRKIADGQPNAVMRDPEVERAYLGQ